MQVVVYLQYALPKRGAPPGHNKLLTIGRRLALEPSRSEEQTWLMTAIYEIVEEGKDPARALELKWERRGRPTNASLHRDSIEFEKALCIARHIESDPKAHGATERAIGATAKEYRCGRDGLRKIWLKLREEATYVLEQEFRQQEDERMEREAAEAAERDQELEDRWREREREWRARQPKSPGKN
jgi:hypothetical protein